MKESEKKMKPKKTISYKPATLPDGTEIMEKTVTTAYYPDTMLDRIMPYIGYGSAICLAIGCIGSIVLGVMQL